MLIDEGEPVLVEPRGFDDCQESHALDYIASGTPNIDGLAAGARRGRTFDDGYLEAGPRQPVGERRARDPGAQISTEYDVRGMRASLWRRMEISNVY